MRQTEIIYGPPGTGKTEYLLRTLEGYLSKGYAPEQIAFVSFSRRAVLEAVTRAREAFPSYSADSFVHFRTIHATAYHLLGLSREDVFGQKHLAIFGEQAGLDFKMGPNQEGQPWEGTVGDKCLTLINNAKNRATPLREEWQRANLDNLSWEVLNHVAIKYARFKEVNGLVDFCDMIDEARTRTLSGVKVLIVDEAQDTNSAQWNLLRGVSKDAEYVHLAGDDDQAVYGWSGADTEMLWRIKGTRTVLPVSHRLPARVKELADRISSGIQSRVPKQYAARAEEGSVSYIPNVDYLDLRGRSTWLLIARNNYQLDALREVARSQGVVYSLSDGRWSWSSPAVKAALAYERLRNGKQVSKVEARNILSFVTRHPVHADTLPDVVVWTNLFSGDARPNWMEGLTAMSSSDREYIRLLRKSGESLSEPGRVRIGTAHSVKGAQADKVAIITDIGARVAQGAITDPDAELRVQYVAATRAREELFIVDPQTRYFWSFN
jgi:superfamily I DNA/RNA helicase